MRTDTVVAYATMGVVVVVLVAVLVRLAGWWTGGTITSWYRTPWKNAAVGGVRGSAHLLGWAVDIVPVTGEMIARARKVFPVVINEGDHIHAALIRGF